MLTRLLTFQSPAAALWLLFFMLTNALCEVLSIATVYPFAALASDPGLLQTNSVLRQLYGWAGRPPLTLFVIQLACVFLASFLLTTASNALTLWLQHRYTLHLRHRLATHLLRSYLAKDYLWLLGQHTADLSKNVLAETDRLIQEVVAKMTTIGMRGLSGLFICVALVLINPWVALTSSLALLICYRQIYGFFRTRLDTMGKRRLEVNQRRHQLAQESLSALKEARLGHRRQFLHREFEQESLAYTRLDLSQRLIGELPRYLTETLAIVAIVGVFCYLVSLGRDPRQAFPWIGLYIMAIWRLVPNLQELYSCLVDVRLNWPLLEKLNGEWDPVQPCEAAEGAQMSEMLALEEVCFTYPGADQAAVRGVTLQIPRHSLVGLVGKTGSGKTTVADLLAGYLVPQSGRVTVDGKPMPGQGWQSQVGYVPQTIYLTSDTIARNIALGLPESEINPDALQRAASIARLDSMLEKLPRGLSTLLGERGLSLSGGERQRIGIARALYHQPQVLILDEATSSLDNQTESAVMGAIEQLAHRHTILLIAHRLTTVKTCDRIFVFDEGRLVSQGTFAELLAGCPIFQGLAHSGPTQSQSN